MIQNIIHDTRHIVCDAKHSLLVLIIIIKEDPNCNQQELCILSYSADHLYSKVKIFEILCDPHIGF